MTLYQPAQRVTVFMADVQRLIPGTVEEASTGRVRVSLDDRMCPVAVDPADHFRIQPIAVPT